MGQVVEGFSLDDHTHHNLHHPGDDDHDEDQPHAHHIHLHPHHQAYCLPILREEPWLLVADHRLDDDDQHAGRDGVYHHHHEQQHVQHDQHGHGGQGIRSALPGGPLPLPAGLGLPQPHHHHLDQRSGLSNVPACPPLWK